MYTISTNGNAARVAEESAPDYETQKPNSREQIAIMALPWQVWDSDGLDATDRMIYAHVYSMQERGLRFFGSNEYLGRLTGCGIRQAKRSVELLVYAGLLKREWISKGTPAGGRRRFLLALKPWEREPKWAFMLEQRRELRPSPVSKGA